MVARKYHRGWSYYHPKKTLSPDEVLGLSGVRHLAFRRTSTSVPRLAVMKEPPSRATRRQLHRWSEADKSVVSPAEFVELLRVLNLQVIEDTKGFYRVTRTAQWHAYARGLRMPEIRRRSTRK